MGTGKSSLLLKGLWGDGFTRSKNWQEEATKEGTWRRASARDQAPVSLRTDGAGEIHSTDLCLGTMA